MVLTCLNYIDGQWLSARSQASLESRNPADWRQIIATFPRSNPADIDAAVQAARKAYQSWRLVPPPARANYLYRFAEVLTQRQEELAQLITQEMGKPRVEARKDVQEGIDCALYYAGEGHRLFGQTTTSEMPDKFVMTMRMPIGVCALITPWTFPVAIPCCNILAAIICGNTVILKPAQDTPACASFLVQVFHDAGLPAGVINLVHGIGSEIGNKLVEHPGINFVSFTGSAKTGAKISAICGRDRKRVSLKLGGKNAQIVMEDADLELALEGAIWGAFGTTGQRSQATSNLILHRDIKDKFTAMLLERTNKLRLGAGTEPNTEVGPLINMGQLQRVSGYLELAHVEGAKVLTGGKIANNGNLKYGFFFEPTILDKVTPNMRIAREEIFGPVVALIEVHSFTEAIKIINETAYGLSSSIYTRDISRAFQAMRDIATGITYINSPTIGAKVHLNFGGNEQTGSKYREGSMAALDTFTEWKTVYVDFSDRL